jgi:CBS domain-containing protein
MLVKYAMETEPVRVPANAPLRTILEAVLGRNQDAAMVVDEVGNLLGLVGIHDILRSIVPRYLDLDANLAKVMHESYFDEVFAEQGDVTAADLMSQSADVDTVSPDDAVIKAAALFVEHRRKVIPVVEGSRLVGVITRRSVLRRALEKLG